MKDKFTKAIIGGLLLGSLGLSTASYVSVQDTVGLQGEKGDVGNKGQQGEDGKTGESGIGISEIEYIGNILVITTSDGNVQSFALNQHELDSTITRVLKTAGDSSSDTFLVVDDENSEMSFRWRITDSGAANISAPIYISAAQSGKDMSEVAKIALRDIVNKVSNDSTNIKSWDIAALLTAYDLTKDEEYLRLAEFSWSTYLNYYVIPRSGSIDYLGFDLYGSLMTTTLMMEYGSTEEIRGSATEAYENQLEHYRESKDIAITEGATGKENYAYYGLIEKEFDLGVYDINDCYSMYYELIDFETITNEDGYTQSLSYATRAFSEVEGFDAISHKVYFNNIIENQLTDYSQVLVEVIQAYSILE